jgi:hypothetical protein
MASEPTFEALLDEYQTLQRPSNYGQLHQEAEANGDTLMETSPPTTKLRRTSKQKETFHEEPLTHEDIWDDSALIEAWDQAAREYQRYHSDAALTTKTRRKKRPTSSKKQQTTETSVKEEATTSTELPQTETTTATDTSNEHPIPWPMALPQGK